MIIPTDEHSPGARAAKVAAYIDGRLAEAWDEQDRTDWRDGLKRVEQLSRETQRQAVHAVVRRTQRLARADADGAERKQAADSPRSSSSPS